MSRLKNNLKNEKTAELTSNSGAFVELIGEFNSVRKDYAPEGEFYDPTDPRNVSFTKKINKVLDKIEILLKELDETI